MTSVSSVEEEQEVKINKEENGNCDSACVSIACEKSEYEQPEQLNKHQFEEHSNSDSSLVMQFGFEDEFVRIALMGSGGNPSVAIQELYDMQARTEEAEKNHARKMKFSDEDLISIVIGMNVKQMRTKWKGVIGSKSRSDLKKCSSKECIDNEIKSDSDSDDSNDFDPNASFYKKNKQLLLKNILCQSARNLLFLLIIFQRWEKGIIHQLSDNNNNMNNKPDVNHCRAFFYRIIDKYLSRYSCVQLVNDLQHIHIYHWDHAELFYEFEGHLGICDIEYCTSYRRHHRSRYKYKADVRRRSLYDIHDDEEEKSIQKEIVCLQWMDEIHCYLMHSLMKFEIEIESDSESESESESESDSSSNDSNCNRVSKAQKERIIQEGMQIQRRQELMEYSNSRSYSLINEHMSQQNSRLAVFEWQKEGSELLQPKYSSMKEEILMNSFCRLSVGEFNEITFKCTKILKSWIGRKLKARESCTNSKHMTIQKTDVIPKELIIAIKLYTDYVSLQFQLKKGLRNGLSDNNDQSMNKTSNDFFWWRLNIFIAVNNFGIKMKKHKFFFGVSSCMYVERVSGFGLFYGPLSMTLRLEVAKRYATNNGMILQFANAYPWKKKDGRYFDVSILSDFKAEHEVLAMLFTTRLSMISINFYIEQNDISDHNYRFVMYLFAQSVLSMNFDLETILITLLDNYMSTVTHDNANNNRLTHVPVTISNEFALICNNQKSFMMWDISVGIREYFLSECLDIDDDFEDSSDSEINHNEKWIVSFDKISLLFPNIEQLTLVNHILNDDIFYAFIDFLNKYQGSVTLKSVAFYFPRYKKLPPRLKIRQLEHSWQRYLTKFRWVFIGFKCGNAPMIALQHVDYGKTPFFGNGSLQFKNMR